MDTMNALDSELGASVAGRIRCVTGHGAWFMMRDPPPNQPEEPDPFARWFDYDGSNGAAINKMLGEQGQLHSPCKTGNFSIHFAHTAALKTQLLLRPGAHDVRQRDLLPRGGGGGASDPDAGGRVHPQGAPRGHRAGGEPGPSAAPIPSCDHQDLLVLASGDLCVCTCKRSKMCAAQALQLANFSFAQLPKTKKHPGGTSSTSPIQAVPESSVQVCACVGAGRGGAEPGAAADRLARGPAAAASRRAPRHLPHQL